VTVLSVQANAKALPVAGGSVDLVVTSTPYFMQVNYMDSGQVMEGQTGHEATPAAFVDSLMVAMCELDRVVKRSGSMFINEGDKYSGYHNGAGKARSIGDPDRAKPAKMPDGPPRAPSVWGVPNKSLMGLPWRLALRCMDDLGWVLRSEIIWHKKSTPERVRDRAWRRHEQWFHFTKSDRYYHDPSVRPLVSVIDGPPASTVHHPAPFGDEWPERFIKRFCPQGGIVLDPFGGSGTTARVASRMGRVGSRTPPPQSGCPAPCMGQGRSRHPAIPARVRGCRRASVGPGWGGCRPGSAGRC